ncbi:WXG100-like domain-containing protein [Saccharopolyspora soli]|uniref:WXG100-like domain-containing protein n=1 Tax=Saccharopolyspora soli TaxID=2926618 RepID=UPI0024139709|nr:toxin glutamine deamidase domain-containing protein [Saccharopolyspora soli]
MPTELPSGLQKALEIVGGQPWPEGDEDGLNRMSAAWSQIAKDVDTFADAVKSSATGVTTNMRGDFADAYAEYVNSKLLPAIEELRKSSEAQANLTKNTAADIQYAKISIIVQLVMLAATLALSWIPGIGQALVAAAAATARAVIMAIIRQVIISIAKGIVLNTAFELALDAAIQGMQFLTGQRTDWNEEFTKGAAISGVVGGAAGGAFVGAIKGLGSFGAGGAFGSAVKTGLNNIGGKLTYDVVKASAEGGGETLGEAASGDASHSSFTSAALGSLDGRGGRGGRGVGNYGNGSPNVDIGDVTKGLDNLAKDGGPGPNVTTESSGPSDAASPPPAYSQSDSTGAPPDYSETNTDTAGAPNNTGTGNSGQSNTSETNTGETNTGETNTGETNTGQSNTGQSNTGETNTGETNTGETNTGETNTSLSNTSQSDISQSDISHTNTGQTDTGGAGQHTPNTVSTPDHHVADSGTGTPDQHASDSTSSASDRGGTNVNGTPGQHAPVGGVTATQGSSTPGATGTPGQNSLNTASAPGQGTPNTASGPGQNTGTPAQNPNTTSGSGTPNTTSSPNSGAANGTTPPGQNTPNTTSAPPDPGRVDATSASPNQPDTGTTATSTASQGSSTPGTPDPQPESQPAVDQNTPQPHGHGNSPNADVGRGSGNADPNTHSPDPSPSQTTNRPPGTSETGGVVSPVGPVTTANTTPQNSTGTGSPNPTSQSATANVQSGPARPVVTSQGGTTTPPVHTESTPSDTRTTANQERPNTTNSGPAPARPQTGTAAATTSQTSPSQNTTADTTQPPNQSQNTGSTPARPSPQLRDPSAQRPETSKSDSTEGHPVATFLARFRTPEPSANTGPDGRTEPTGSSDRGGQQHSGGDADPGTPERQEQIDAAESRRDATPSGSSYHTDPNMQELARRVPDDGVHHTVDVHALPDGRVRIGDHTFTAKEFADMLRRDPNWDSSKPIRLLSCDAGTSGLARDLSRELGVPVTAPRGLAWTDDTGRVFASDTGQDGRPGWPPNGGWDTHRPDGTTTPAGNDGFHSAHDSDDLGEAPDDAGARGNSGRDPGDGHEQRHVAEQPPAMDPATANDLYASNRAIRGWLDQIGGEWPDVARDHVVRLSDVLPESHWWRMYIDPQHHFDAQVQDWANPGGLYDHQRSPGFQEGMVNAYRSFLDDPDTLRRPMNWDEYLNMHRSASQHARSRAADQTDFNVTGTDPDERVFHHLGAERPADDLLTEQVDGVALVTQQRLEDMPADQRANVITTLSPENGHLALGTAYRAERVPNLVNAVFRQYYDSIEQAHTEHERLRAIAQAVRTLHVMHLFGDGNGRLNVNLLLPRLLQTNGFQPVITPSMSHLFSGGFSLDQIATALRWGQDLDLRNGLDDMRGDVRIDIPDLDDGGWSSDHGDSLFGGLIKDDSADEFFPFGSLDQAEQQPAPPSEPHTADTPGANDRSSADDLVRDLRDESAGRHTTTVIPKQHFTSEQQALLDMHGVEAVFTGGGTTHDNFREAVARSLPDNAPKEHARITGKLNDFAAHNPGNTDFAALAHAADVQVHVLNPNGTWDSYGPETGRPVHIVKSTIDGVDAYLGTREAVHIGRPSVSYPGSTVIRSEDQERHVIHRGEFEVETVKGEHYVRLYTAVLNPVTTDSSFKDVHQHPDGTVEPFIGAEKKSVFWVGGGRPLRAVQWVAKYEHDVNRKPDMQPVLRSYLVPLGKFTEISQRAIVEPVSKDNELSLNTDQRGDVNQFGLRGEDFEQLQQHTLKGSLVTYTQSGRDYQLREVAGRQEDISDLHVRLGLPEDFDSAEFGRENDPWFKWTPDGRKYFRNDPEELNDLAERLSEFYYTWHNSPASSSTHPADTGPGAGPRSDPAANAQRERMNVFLNTRGPGRETVRQFADAIGSALDTAVRQRVDESGIPVSTKALKNFVVNGVRDALKVPHQVLVDVTTAPDPTKSPHRDTLENIRKAMTDDPGVSARAAEKVTSGLLAQFDAEVGESASATAFRQQLESVVRTTVQQRFDQLHEAWGDQLAQQQQGKRGWLSGARGESFTKGVITDLEKSPQLKGLFRDSDVRIDRDVFVRRLGEQFVPKALKEITKSDLVDRASAELENHFRTRQSVVADALENEIKKGMSKLVDPTFRKDIVSAVSPSLRDPGLLDGFRFDGVSRAEADAFMEKVPFFATQAAIGSFIAIDEQRTKVDFNTREAALDEDRGDVRGRPFANEFGRWRAENAVGYTQRHAPGVFENHRRIGEDLNTTIAERLANPDGHSAKAILDQLVSDLDRGVTDYHDQIKRKFDEVVVPHSDPYRSKDQVRPNTFSEHAQMVLNQYLELTKNDDDASRFVSREALVKAILFHDMEKVNSKNQFGDAQDRHDREPEHRGAVTQMNRHEGLWTSRREFELARSVVDSDPFGFYFRDMGVDAKGVYDFVHDLAHRAGRSDGAAPTAVDVRNFFHEFHQYYQADFSSYTKYARFVNDTSGQLDEGYTQLRGLATDDNGLVLADGGRRFAYDPQRTTGASEAKFQALSKLFDDAVEAEQKHRADSGPDERDGGDPGRSPDGDDRGASQSDHQPEGPERTAPIDGHSAPYQLSPSRNSETATETGHRSADTAVPVAEILSTPDFPTSDEATRRSTTGGLVDFGGLMQRWAEVGGRDGAHGQHGSTSATPNEPESTSPSPNTTDANSMHNELPDHLRDWVRWSNALGINQIQHDTDTTAANDHEPADTRPFRDRLPEYARDGQSLGSVVPMNIKGGKQLHERIVAMLGTLAEGEPVGVSAITGRLGRSRFESFVGSGRKSMVRVGAKWFEVHVRAELDLDSVTADDVQQPSSLSGGEVTDQHQVAHSDPHTDTVARNVGVSGFFMSPAVGPYASLGFEGQSAAPTREHSSGVTTTAQSVIRPKGEAQRADVPVRFHVTITDSTGGVTGSTVDGQATLLLPTDLSNIIPHQPTEQTGPPREDWAERIEFIAPEAVLLDEQALFDEVSSNLHPSVTKFGAHGRTVLQNFLGNGGIRTALATALSGSPVVSPDLASPHGSYREAVQLSAKTTAAELVGVVPGKGELYFDDSSQHDEGNAAASKSAFGTSAAFGGGGNVPGVVYGVAGATGGVSTSVTQTSNSGTGSTSGSGLNVTGDIGMYKLAVDVEVVTSSGERITAPATAYVRMGLPEAKAQGLPVPDGTRDKLVDSGERFEPPYLAAAAAAGHVRAGSFAPATRVQPQIENALRDRSGFAKFLPRWDKLQRDTVKGSGFDAAERLVNLRKLTAAFSPTALRSKLDSLLGPGVSVQLKRRGLFTDEFLSVTVKAKVSPGHHLGQATGRSVTGTTTTSPALTSATTTEKGWSLGVEGRIMIPATNAGVDTFTSPTVVPARYSDTRTSKNTAGPTTSTTTIAVGSPDSQVFEHDIEFDVEITSYTRARPWVRRLTPGSPFRVTPTVSTVAGTGPDAPKKLPKITGKVDLWVSDSAALRTDPAEFMPGKPGVVALTAKETPSINDLLDQRTEAPAFQDVAAFAGTEALRDEAVRQLTRAADGDGVLGLPGSEAYKRIDRMFAPETLRAGLPKLLAQGARSGGFRYERRLADRVGALGMNMSLSNPKLVLASEGGPDETTFTGGGTASAESSRKRAVAGSASLGFYARSSAADARGRGQFSTGINWTPWSSKSAKSEDLAGKVGHTKRAAVNARTVLVAYDANVRMVAETREESLLNGAKSRAGADVQLPGSVFVRMTEDQARAEGLLPPLEPRTAAPGTLTTPALVGEQSSSFGAAVVEDAPDLTELVQNARTALGGSGKRLLPKSVLDDSMNNLQRLLDVAAPESITSLVDGALDGGVPLLLHDPGLVTSDTYQVLLKATVTDTEFLDVVHDGSQVDDTVTATTASKETHEHSSSYGGQLRFVGRGLFTDSNTGASGSEGVSTGRSGTRSKSDQTTVANGVTTTRIASAAGPAARYRANVRFDLVVERGSRTYPVTSLDTEMTVRSSADDQKISAGETGQQRPHETTTDDVPAEEITPERLKEWQEAGLGKLPSTAMVEAYRGAANLRAATENALRTAGAGDRLTSAGTGAAHTLATALTNSTVLANLPTMLHKPLGAPELHESALFRNGHGKVEVYGRVKNPELAALSDSVTLMQSNSTTATFTGDASASTSGGEIRNAGEGFVTDSNGNWHSPGGVDVSTPAPLTDPTGKADSQRSVVVQPDGRTALVGLDVEYRVVAERGGRKVAVDLSVPGSVLVRMTATDLSQLGLGLPDSLTTSQDAVKDAAEAWRTAEQAVERAQRSADDRWLDQQSGLQRLAKAAPAGTPVAGDPVRAMRRALVDAVKEAREIGAALEEGNTELHRLREHAREAQAVTDLEAGLRDLERRQAAARDRARQIQEALNEHRSDSADQRSRYAAALDEVAAAREKADEARQKWWDAKRELDRQITKFNRSRTASLEDTTTADSSSTTNTDPITTRSTSDDSALTANRPDVLNDEDASGDRSSTGDSATPPLSPRQELVDFFAPQEPLSPPSSSASDTIGDPDNADTSGAATRHSDTYPRTGHSHQQDSTPPSTPAETSRNRSSDPASPNSERSTSTPREQTDTGTTSHVVLAVPESSESQARIDAGAPTEAQQEETDSSAERVVSSDGDEGSPQRWADFAGPGGSFGPSSSGFAHPATAGTIQGVDADDSTITFRPDQLQSAPVVDEHGTTIGVLFHRAPSDAQRTQAWAQTNVLASDTEYWSVPDLGTGDWDQDPSAATYQTPWRAAREGDPLYVFAHGTHHEFTTMVNTPHGRRKVFLHGDDLANATAANPYFRQAAAANQHGPIVLLACSSGAAQATSGMDFANTIHGHHPRLGNRHVYAPTGDFGNNIWTYPDGRTHGVSAIEDPQSRGGFTQFPAWRTTHQPVNTNTWTAGNRGHGTAHAGYQHPVRWGDHRGNDSNNTPTENDPPATTAQQTAASDPAPQPQPTQQDPVTEPPKQPDEAHVETDPAVLSPEITQSHGGQLKADAFFVDPDFRSSAEDRHEFRTLFESYEDYAVDTRDMVALDDIPEEDLVAVHAYTKTDFYAAVNQALRNDDETALAKYQATIRCITSGLNQLPKHEGALVRGIEVDDSGLGPLLARYTPGAIVRESAFTSASVESITNGNVEFIVHSRTGRSVRDVSLEHRYTEAIFTPGTEFKVMFQNPGGSRPNVAWTIGLIENGSEVEAPPADTPSDVSDLRNAIQSMLGFKSRDTDVLGRAMLIANEHELLELHQRNEPNPEQANAALVKSINEIKAKIADGGMAAGREHAQHIAGSSAQRPTSPTAPEPTSPEETAREHPAATATPQRWSGTPVDGPPTETASLEVLADQLSADVHHSPSVIAEVGFELELPGVRVPFSSRGEVLLEGIGWKLETDDMMISAPSDLEFVLSPMSSMRQIEEAMRDIVGVVSRMRELTSTDRTFSLSAAASGSTRQVFIRKDTPVTVEDIRFRARMQSTYGIGLTDISKVIDELLTEKQAEAIHKNTEKIRRFYAEKHSEPLSSNASGFVELLAMYLERAQAKTSLGGDVHALFRMNSRSDFVSIHDKLLTESDRQQVRRLLLADPGQDVPDFMAALGRKQSDMVFARPYTDISGSAKSPGPRTVDWLDSIVHGRNEGAFKKDLMSPPPGYPLHTGDLDVDYGMGAMGVDEVNGLVLFEIRGAPYRPENLPLNGRAFHAVAREYRNATRHNSSLLPDQRAASPQPRAEEFAERLNQVWTNLSVLQQTVTRQGQGLTNRAWQLMSRISISSLDRINEIEQAPIPAGMEGVLSRLGEVENALRSLRDVRVPLTDPDQVLSLMPDYDAALRNFEQELWNAEDDLGSSFVDDRGQPVQQDLATEPPGRSATQPNPDLGTPESSQSLASFLAPQRTDTPGTPPVAQVPPTAGPASTAQDVPNTTSTPDGAVTSGETTPGQGDVDTTSGTTSSSDSSSRTDGFGPTDDSRPVRFGDSPTRNPAPDPAVPVHGRGTSSVLNTISGAFVSPENVQPQPVRGITSLPSINADTRGASGFASTYFPNLRYLNPSRDIYNCTQTIIAVDEMLNGRHAPAPELPAHLRIGANVDRNHPLRQRNPWAQPVNVETWDQVIHMAAQVPNSRGYVIVYRADRSAHVMNVINTPRGVVFLDGQSGRLGRLDPDIHSVTYFQYYPSIEPVPMMQSGQLFQPGRWRPY